MAIDPDMAMAATFAPVTTTWTRDLVILYHLGLGAGDPPTDQRELRYVYEPVLHVLPTFSSLLASDAMRKAAVAPGLDYAATSMVQGSQEVEVLAPVPPEGEAVSTARVEAVFDKGNAALVVLAAETALADGALLARNRLTLFIRGAGGFGGDGGPTSAGQAVSTSSGGAMTEIVVQTLPQQAAMFRLAGDRTPLHIDPAFARAAGLVRPTLPGLCTWGMVCKAVVDNLLDGDVTAVASFTARFSGPVYPGETLVVRAQRDGRHIAMGASVGERSAPALSHAVLTTV